MLVLPPEIQKVQEPLVSFERELPDPSDEAISNFAKALFDLWLFIRFNQDSKHLGLAERLRFAYVRRFLETVPALPALREEDWFNIRIELELMGDELDKLFIERPKLRIEYNNFTSLYPDSEFQMWKDQLIRTLQEKE